MKYSPSPVASKRGGFSLVEVTLALGILGFAFLAIFGMLPVGLQTFRDSADKTQTTQIAQKLLAEAQQTPFENLDTLYGTVTYYDGEGERLESASGESISGPAGFVYSAMVLEAGADVKSSNASSVGISASRTRMLLIKVEKNRIVTADADSLAQFTFAVADVKL